MSYLKLVSENKNKVKPVVAIDGPAGSGKSTVARLLAYKLNYILVDTGALYRSLAYIALDRNISLQDQEALFELCNGLKFRFGELTIDAPGSIPQVKIFVSDQDLSTVIRSAEIGMAASNISKHPMVRDALLETQRFFGEKGGVIMEGRDIGTVIFPKADFKFFLTANIESRAKRRFAELEKAGHNLRFEQVLRETKIRDDQDMNRAIAPLKQAKDAILIDSTQKNLNEVVQEVYNIITAKK